MSTIHCKIVIVQHGDKGVYYVHMFFRSLSIGFFLAVRYVRRANIWATLLIIFIMLLTFLNVVTVRGILIGLPEGARIAYESQYSGQVIVSPLPDFAYVKNTQFIEGSLSDMPGYQGHTSRYIEPAQIEANYKENRKTSVLPDSANIEVIGISPQEEDSITNLSDFVIEGRFLTESDLDGILVGHQLLDRYADSLSLGSTISEVFPDSKVRLTINGFEREYIVVGVIRTKVSENHRRVFMVGGELRKLGNRYDYNVDEIAISVNTSVTPLQFKEILLDTGIGKYATVETGLESQGKFLDDIRVTFEILSSVIGGIGIAVAVITVFIVIFIFAITRQKEIGILKGIGISKIAIESSYVFLSIFYAIIGIVIGNILLYVWLEPYMLLHPIDFPFSDGLLIVPWRDTVDRSLMLLVATIFAGYVPARMVVKKNTINSILGR